MTVTTRTIAQLTDDLRTYGIHDEQVLTEFAASYPAHVNERLATAGRPTWDATAGAWHNDEHNAEHNAAGYGIPTWDIPEAAHRFADRIASDQARRKFIDGDRSEAVIRHLVVTLGRTEQKQLAADAGMTWQELKALMA